MEIIMVKLNGREFPTHIDEHGVQRFVGNQIIYNYVHRNIGLWEKLKHGEFERLGGYGLNEVSIDYRVGMTGITLDEMLDFFTGMRYSVSGMIDLSHFEAVEVENPLWD